MSKRYDPVIEEIAEYAFGARIESGEAFDTAKLCLADTLACGFMALDDPACKRHLGPIVPGVTVARGARVPGTEYLLDPVRAAYNMGVMNRWLDYNDTWLAAEWGHPSDNMAALFAVADYMSEEKRYTVRDILEAMIKAHEIQGVLALKNSLNARGFDHVLFVKVASAAMAAVLLGCTLEQVKAAVSNAFVDAGPLRTYRHAPNTNQRKSWAAGDACARGVFLALQALKGEPGCHSALTAPKWGFQDCIMGGKPVVLERPLGSYVMENVLFKVRYPAEFHAQTAVEAAIQMQPLVLDKFDQIVKIEIATHESALRIISKTGPLTNFADRDHCMQYMVAAALLFGTLKAEYYSDSFAKGHPQIDTLREKMHVSEHKPFSQDYLDPSKRSIASSVSILFKDGTRLGPVTVEYPLGHRRRRKESLPFLQEKLEAGLKAIGSESLIALFPPDEQQPFDLFLTNLTAKKQDYAGAVRNNGKPARQDAHR